MQAGAHGRTYATLLETLNRHPAEGHGGARACARRRTAVVGVVRTPGVGIERNRRFNPVQSRLPMHLSGRCGARTRSGSQCRSPAMPNGRCRMHGDNRRALQGGIRTLKARPLRRRGDCEAS
ncbi:MAG: HGGxSTG domain-containing protein [Rhodoplanes sp.]